MTNDFNPQKACHVILYCMAIVISVHIYSWHSRKAQVDIAKINAAAELTLANDHPDLVLNLTIAKYKAQIVQCSDTAINAFEYVGGM